MVLRSSGRTGMRRPSPRVQKLVFDHYIFPSYPIRCFMGSATPELLCDVRDMLLADQILILLSTIQRDFQLIRQPWEQCQRRHYERRR